MIQNHTPIEIWESVSLGYQFPDNFSYDINNSASNDTANSTYNDQYDIIQNDAIQALFCLLYSTIFVLGVFGNVLVCYVVYRNRAMQTVTNFFITNLALSDILLCTLSVPFTPLYSFLAQWVFGSVLCHLVAYAQGTSVYISTLTLMSIAIDRYCVIIYPFHPRMKLSTCFAIITGIWIFSLMVTLPYGIYMSHNLNGSKYYCEEAWPSERFRQIYGALTAITQFVIPLFIIAFCYIKVSLKLKDRARSKPGAKNSRKEESDRERKRRTNRMLIAMVTIFAVSWLPLNVINFANDISIAISNMRYYYLCFFMVHALAMSSTCYNPFLYAWLNENFRKEFKQVLPFFDAAGKNPTSGAGRSGNWRSERTCNGNNETIQDTLVTSTVNRMGSVRIKMAGDASPTPIQEEKPMIEVRGRPSKDDSVDVETVLVPSATFAADNESVHLHLIAGDGRTSPPAKGIVTNGEGFESIELKSQMSTTFI